MENKLSILITCLALFALGACSSQRIAQAKNNFQGVVLEQKFNSMPMLGSANTNGAPLATQLFIYKSTSIQQLDSLTGPFCSRINDTLLATVASDEKGNFNTYLKPGTYSLFVRYENAYYIPYFSGAKWTALFEIKESEPTKLEIIVRGNTNIQ